MYKWSIGTVIVGCHMADDWQQKYLSKHFLSLEKVLYKSDFKGRLVHYLKIIDTVLKNDGRILIQIV